MQQPYRLLIIFFALLGGGLPSYALAAPTDDPVPIVQASPNSWVVDAGFVTYGANCFAAEFTFNASLKRKSTTGPFTTSIANISDDSENCLTYAGLDVDEEAIYYYDWSNLQIVKRDSGNYSTEIPLTSFIDDNQPSYNGGFTDLAVDSTHVYWSADDDTIKRVVKEGGTAETFAEIDNGFDLEIVGSTLYWTDQTGFYYAPTGCETLPCTEKTQIDDAPSRYITPGTFSFLTGRSIYYVTENKNVNSSGDVFVARDTISVYRCSNNVVIPIDPVLPINPGGESAPNDVTDVSAASGDGGSNCDVEDIHTIAPDGFLGKVSVGDGHIFWEEYTSAAGETRIYRLPIGSNSADVDPEPIYVQPGLFAYGKTYADNIGVYFRTRDQGIVRLPFDAEPITREFRINNWEVTQAVQNLNNDVPLVGNKPTVVRVYGSHVDGPRANAVAARLYGERNGTPLSGPLFNYITPVNGTEALSSGYAPDRGRAFDGWMFELPASWTQSGNLTLRVEVDPDEIYDAKVSDSRTFTFTPEPAACLIYMPVRTHNPRPSLSDPNVGAMIDRFTQIWPVPSTRVYWQSNAVEEVQVCWAGPFPYPCGGPFELNEGASFGDWFPDKDEAQTYIATRALFSDDPDICDAENSAVHYVGMVHRDAPTGGTAGYALLDLGPVNLPNSSWVVNPPAGAANTDFGWPRRGSTLAQEVTHNYNRGHVACGTSDGVDNNYPYPVCQLDNVGGTNHYGFNTTTNLPIEPDVAQDFMSYGNDRWVSDYTYKAVKNRFGIQSNLISAASALSPEAIALEEAATFIVVTGAVDPNQERGVLAYAYQLETDETSIGIMRKMQTLAAAKWQAAEVSASFSTLRQADEYHLRLLDSEGNVLDDRVVELRTPDNHGEPTQARPFFMTIPKPEGTVATIELVGDDVLDSRSPGVNAPSISISAPTGGSTVGDPVVIEWTASDPDSGDLLLYNVSYSADNGNHWINLATDYVGDPTATAQTLTLTENNLPGTDGATGLIRVIASDGYNSTSATSDPFIVENKPPQPFITSPAKGNSYAANGAIPLRGFAIDAEEGSLSEGLAWTIDDDLVAGSDGDETVLSIDGLAPGTHVAQLTATDPASQTGIVSATFHIDPLTVPNGSTATLDGSCNDSVYDAAEVIQLAPFADGGRTTAYLLRSSSYLHLCLLGLRDSASGLGTAGIRIDTNLDGGAAPQADDLAFWIDEMGTPVDQRGDGSTFVNANAPGGFAARAVGDGTGLWSAELRIAADILGGWEQAMGIALFHTSVDDGEVQWPYAAEVDVPDSWAGAYAGSTPQVTEITPLAGMTSAPLELTVVGSDLTEDMQVLWDGTPLPTQFVTETQLVATVDGPLAGIHRVTVIPTPTSELATSPVQVDINNPAPSIIGITPDSADQGQSDAVVLSVKGAAFVEGASILWDGEPLATTYVNSGELQATIAASRLVIGGERSVAVANPSPSQGTAESMAFTVEPQAAQPESTDILLPFIVTGE